MVYLVIVLAVFSADMMLKRYVDVNLQEQEVREYLGGRLRVRRVHNRGMLMGALRERPRLIRRLTGSVLVIVAIRLVTALFRGKKRSAKTALAFIAGGALSNWFDHFHQGYVVDYLNVKVPVRFLRKIYFNLADCFILLGAVISLLAPDGGRKALR